MRSGLEKVDCSMLWKAKVIMGATGVEAGVRAQAEVSAGVEAEARASGQMAEAHHLRAHAMSLEAEVALGPHLRIAHEAAAFHRIGLARMEMANHAFALEVVVSHPTEWKQHLHRISLEICM